MSQGVITLPQDLGDRYVIERELGHGATATVYLARDLKFEERSVAIKILSADFALAVPAERFLREIRTTAKLSHPHIVPLFDAGTTQGSPPRAFYVMRFIDGDVLSDVIARGPLSIPEALRIARQAASALGHAHRHGVIHRDIKPGNMILEDGHTWVTDFGIARAIASDDSATVTSTGVTIGTPAYMSPEQAMGQADLDGRSDIYSLGCVLFEMLAGKMPFEGPDIQSVMNKQLVESPRRIRDLRPDVPERVEQLLDIALAKRREDRFPSAAELAEALSLEGAGALTPTRTQPVPGERRKGIRWKSKTAVAAGVTLVVGLFVVAAMLKRPELKADRYLVTSDWQYGQGVDAAMDAGRLLQDQLNQWKGLTVLSSDSSTSRRPGAVARRAGAAWYVRGGVSRVGDSIRVRAQLFGTRGDSLVRERSVNLATSLVGGDSALGRLADQLLFDDTVWTANRGRAGTRTVASRQAFARGLADVQQWALVNADSAFRQAGDADANYSQAHLWLAQVRVWAGAGVAKWRSASERAAAGRTRLSRRDRILLDALQQLGRDSIGNACALLGDLTDREPYDFAGWYGLASCLSQDDVVVPDSRSASGLRFRSSYHRASKAYQRAFELLPAIHRALSGNSYASVRRLLKASGDLVRSGRGEPPDTFAYAAHPAWHNDTLAFVPYPERLIGRAPILEDMRVAVRRQRELFRDIATAWVTASPTSPDAVEALAISLGLLEDRSAIEQMRRARALSTDARQRTRLAGAEVWMRVQFSIPKDTAGLRYALALTDSLLEQSRGTESGEALMLTSLATLTGRANLAARLSRDPSIVQDWDIPPALADEAAPLLVFSALGGPVDSIRRLERDVDEKIDERLLASEQPTARMRWLARSARLVFPDVRFASMPKLFDLGEYLIAADSAFLAGDVAAVRQMFVSTRAARRFVSPSDVAIEGIYSESRLLVAIGNIDGAIAWLDGGLSALEGTAPEILLNPANSGALGRAMVLRADLAARVNDRARAREWALAVSLLWAHADEFLQPTVRRMRQLASQL